MAYDPTDVNEEITRKGFETLMNVVGKYRDGYISSEAYSEAVGAVWGTTAGLVIQEASDTFDEALNALQKTTSKHARMYFNTKQKRFVLASWTIGKPEIKLSFIGGKFEQQVKAFDSPLKAREAFQKVIAKLDADDSSNLIYGDDIDSWA